MSQDTGKPLHAKRLVFRIYFSSSIMELQKCSLACPYREVLEKSQVIYRGLCYSKLWILSYLSLDVWWNENHLHQWERGLGSVVVCSSDGLVFQDSRLELNWNTARRPSALVRMVKIHSWTTVWIQTLLCISNRLQMKCTATQTPKLGSSLRSDLLIHEAELSGALSFWESVNEIHISVWEGIK